MECPVHVLMLSTQAVRGLPRLRAPGIVPSIVFFSRQLPCFPVAARGCLPPGANVSVAAPANQIGNRYSYGYNDDVDVQCHEHYAKLGV